MCIYCYCSLGNFLFTGSILSSNVFGASNLPAICIIDIIRLASDNLVSNLNCF
jgi:hypothetical protein